MLNKKKIFIWIILIYFINIRIVSCEKQNKNKINLKFKIPEGINFIHAAKIATKSVVHIKSTYKAKKKKYKEENPLNDIFKDFFGNKNNSFKIKPENNQKYSSGSGVIISENGYIVTNNHVINNANEIEITLNNNKKYKAKLIGIDCSTDIALLKIKESGLPYLKFGNSDTLQVGEWVMAVGNPFKLKSTVTTGIVSAKARNIKIINDKMSIESFIQTDAAVNTGNSGGALVNLKGELIGINTAIATSTGNFSGYSFAIPASIVKKITTDLKKHGNVQRVVLGIIITNVNADISYEKNLNIFNGVYVVEVNKEGIACLAGIKKGDIITEINKNKIKNASELQEQIALCKPGNKITITFYRNKEKKNTSTIFKNIKKEIKTLKNKEEYVKIRGAIFENISKSLQKKLKIEGGVRIKKILKGGWKKSGINQDFIITRIDNELIKDINDLIKILNKKNGGILIEGIYENGKKSYYGIEWKKTNS